MKNLVILIMVMATSLPIYSQQLNTDVADSLFKNKNWNAAVLAYEKITKANPRPRTGLTFNRLGTSYYYTGRYREAIRPYSRAIEISGNPNVMYSLACVYNKVSQRDSCYYWLMEAANKGFLQYQQLSVDGDLKDLHGSPAFESALQKVKYNALPCLRQPEYRQFDFWLGVWTVYDTRTNKLAGTSEIKNILGECVILENWQPVAGAAGKSFNIYNHNEKKWRQTYVDEHGVFSEYYNGEYRNGVMQFQLKKNDASDTVRRMSFFKISDAEVKQVGEASTDHGKTWLTEFALTYTK